MLTIPNPRLWSPDDPYLYDLDVRLLRDGRAVDHVRSYFGMRKIEAKRDAKVMVRIHLNGREIFNLGVLDQGFRPDGSYTAPTDAALKFDVETIKSMGFNTIRKHIKVEPERWYYHCDRLNAMMVGVYSLSIFAGGLIAGRLGGVYEKLSTAGFLAHSRCGSRHWRSAIPAVGPPTSAGDLRMRAGARAQGGCASLTQNCPVLGPPYV